MDGGSAAIYNPPHPGKACHCEKSRGFGATKQTACLQQSPVIAMTLRNKKDEEDEAIENKVN